MAFFDSVKDFTRNIAAKTNEALDETRAKMKISAERAAAREKLAAIGEVVYGRFVETGAADEDIQELLNEVKAHYETIEKIQAEIRRPEKPASTEEKNTVVCAECGAENDENSKFCRECGAKLVMPEPKAEPVKVVCPSCGAENAEGTRFCRECGTRIEAAVQPVFEEEPEEEPEVEPEEEVIEAPVERECPDCGEKVSAETRFCPVCGKRLDA